MSPNDKPPTPSPPRPTSNPLVPKPPRGSWRDFFSRKATAEQIEKQIQQTRGYSAATAKPEVKEKPKLRLVKGGKR